ncbi:hypothetical protein HNO86_21540 [Pseudomonas sp. C1C7]|uniref:hypothetical protein n=1 Tax=Pseudomonas sp. C1C7 TaxID=2735272 RepID=UPI0015868C26|nr:hypothetical protein [Pseudomonas sp. C1C7]NUT77632.1 hypothetical protein [Pseudomonas sp. C1C7]
MLFFDDLIAHEDNVSRTFPILGTAFSVPMLLTCSVHAATPQSFHQPPLYELRATPSGPQCVPSEAGLPASVWSPASDYGPETSMLFEEGNVLVLSAVHKPSGEHVSHRFYKREDLCKQDLERKPETTSLTKTAGGDGLTYVQRLQRDYGARLHFATAQAERTVRTINIDCRAMDGRYLPLHNALLARLENANEPNAWIETRVASAGKGLKVYDSVHMRDGKVRKPQLIFEVNEWGAVTQHGVRSDVLENACYGTHGPIWQF